MKNIRIFYLKISICFCGKIFSILNRRVFVMDWNGIIKRIDNTKRNSASLCSNIYSIYDFSKRRSPRSECASRLICDSTVCKWTTGNVHGCKASF